MPDKNVVDELFEDAGAVTFFVTEKLVFVETGPIALTDDSNSGD